MSDVITLSGWGQPHDALREAAPGALHVDYARAGSLEGALELLSAHADARIVVGWSMGGQLAVHAVARGVLKPDMLVLISTPFKQVQEKLTMERFRSNYLKNPERALDKAYALIAYNDTRAGYIEPKLAEARGRMQQHAWLDWLDALSAHNCADIDYTRFPPTLLLHGDRDAVVNVAESQAFHKALPEAKLHVFDGCGHAPHWHDEARVHAVIGGGLQ